jgi:hypothetical protein
MLVITAESTSNGLLFIFRRAMINYTKLKTRTAALATLGVFGIGALLQPAPAQASSKEKLYKGGAVALGVLGAYFIVKGKTIPGAIAGAGAYYAYKKGKDAGGDDDYDYYENRSSRNDNYRNPDYRSRDYRNSDSNRYPDYSLR